MRGLTLLLMLFVNDLYVPGVPQWMVHTETDFDGMGLADWVFPGFLFMVGMAIPFAFQNRFQKGDPIAKLIKHILIRTFSLIVIGVLFYNSSRLNPDLSGMRKDIWILLVLVSVFLVWNQYQTENKWIVWILKSTGITGLIFLAAIFRSGTPENITWLRTGWWGIPGLIGWGYLVASVVYLIARENLLKTASFLILFFVLNIFDTYITGGILIPFKPLFGVVISGSTPLLVLFGLFFSLILRKTGLTNLKKFLVTGVITGLFSIVAGFVLRHWFIISKNLGTPSWVMICTGISILVFILLFLVIDVWKLKQWTFLFLPA